MGFFLFLFYLFNLIEGVRNDTIRARGRQSAGVLLGLGYKKVKRQLQVLVGLFMIKKKVKVSPLFDIFLL